MPKDPYIIGEAYRVGDITRPLLEDLDPTYECRRTSATTTPSTWTPMDNPTAVVGYRDGDTWFNAAGTEIQDPDILAVNEVYPRRGCRPRFDAPLTSNAFEDYAPQVNMMPRVVLVQHLG